MSEKSSPPWSALDPKEIKVKSVAQSFYSRKDVQKAIFDFCKGRETVPKYFEGFGKRPQCLDYPTEVLTLARNGATSFHCSEERWNDIMSIGSDSITDLSDLRSGWDLLIDIDSKYFEVAKYAAVSIIESLENHGVGNIGVKFSGNKGFHIIVPWEAFPQEINGEKTSSLFPSLPRAIVSYLMDNCKDKLEEYLKADGELWNSLKGSKGVSMGVRCEDCKNLASAYYLINLSCPACGTGQELRRSLEEVESSDKDSSFSNGKKRKCVQCSSPVVESFKKKVYYCDESKCNNKRASITSLTNPSAFSSEALPDIYEQLGLDVVLVSPRHLFRAPYSLHEKTSLVSVVIDKSRVLEFKHSDANPLGIIIKDFLPVSTSGEARGLVVNALDWLAKTDKDKSSYKGASSLTGKKDFKEVVIDRSKLQYAPVIDSILKGLVDGRKRGLFILINYFKSLNFSQEEVSKIVIDWNKKNSKPLRDGYIKTQISWSFNQKKLLPPNYDKPHYKGIGITPTAEELKSKNPVSYTIRKMLGKGGGKGYK